MSFSIDIMGSSSSGNCALVEGGGVRVLLDAGFSGRRIVEWLSAIGKPIETVSKVLLTHEHGDHAKGLRGLSRFPHLKFVSTHGTASACQRDLKQNLPWVLFESGQRFALGGLEVETFRLPHDALDPVGFLLRAGGSNLFDPWRSAAWVTDLGHVPAGLADQVAEVDVLFLESNHDPSLLEMDSKRPFSVKQRILGRHGHLSNPAALEFLLSVERPRWQKILLGHISRDCNCVSRVRECFMQSPLVDRIGILEPEKVGCGSILL